MISGIAVFSACNDKKSGQSEEAQSDVVIEVEELEPEEVEEGSFGQPIK